MADHQKLVEQIATKDVETWPVGREFALWTRMRVITLEVIVRAVMLAGKTQIATAILEHRLGAQPSQDQIGEFLMNIASRWKDGYQSTVFVGQIQASMGI